MIHILGLVARAGAGKTTVANHLANKYGARVVSLATPLKRAAQKVLGFTDEQLWGPQSVKEAVDPRYGFSPRWFLQRLGTEGLRDEFGPEVHLRALVHYIERLDEQLDHEQVYIVDDVRFPNEASFLRESTAWNGAIVKIVCTDLPANDNGGHASERGVDEVSEELLAGTAISSRMAGVADLVGKVETILDSSPSLRSIQKVLAEGRKRRAA